MKNDVHIIDRGRGAQLSTNRITVLDVFYYLHRGDDFDFIHQVMPSLSREEFDAVVAYVNEHHDELVELDRRAEEFIRRGIEEQKAKGLYRELDESVPLKQRLLSLKERMAQLLAERNGGESSPRR